MAQSPKHRSEDIQCPCGSLRPYIHCCQPFLANTRLPATAEELMRSRYTAYVLLVKDYLLQTWHISTRPVQLELTADPPLKWRELRIVHTTQGSEADNVGTVEFIARYKLNGKAEQMHEISAFVREQGTWFYVNAVTE